MFLTILTSHQPMQLAIIKGRLESEGIACFIQDEHTTQIQPLFSIATGGAKLQVREEDLDRALEILKDGKYI